MREVYPRQNGKSTLLLNFIKLQDELRDVKHTNYLQSIQTHLLEEENNKLKQLLKECKEFVGLAGYLSLDNADDNTTEQCNKLLTKINEVLK